MLCRNWGKGVLQKTPVRLEGGGLQEAQPEEGVGGGGGGVQNNQKNCKKCLPLLSTMALADVPMMSKLPATRSKKKSFYFFSQRFERQKTLQTHKNWNRTDMQERGAPQRTSL